MTDEERAVTEELALAADTPNAKVLNDFLERYPEHRELLISYAIDLAALTAFED